MAGDTPFTAGGELAHGPSLAEVLATSGPLPPARAAEIGAQVTAALLAAHRMRVVHGAVKPANILFDGDRAVLTGFGFGARDHGPEETGPGVELPAYVPPELVKGLAPTPASDLWSLGATLFHAVEGRPPYDRATAGETLKAIATEDPAPAAHAGPLAPVIATLLRRDPAARQSAEWLQGRLAQISSLALRPPSPPRLPRRRWPLAVAATGLALLLALVALYVFVAAPAAAYKGNERAVAELGAPKGFHVKSDQKLGSGRLRRTFTGCTATCLSPVRLANADAVRLWLHALPSVTAVFHVSLQTCVTGPGCTIGVVTRGDPRLSGIRIWTTARGDLYMELTVG